MSEKLILITTVIKDLEEGIKCNKEIIQKKEEELESIINFENNITLQKKLSESSKCTGTIKDYGVINLALGHMVDYYKGLL